jgi:ring-1,2-phenylacetyl-CoA epoxidase subunit PaaD
MVNAAPALADVWAWLGAIPDPEIPAISIVDLGIVRDVAWRADDATLVVGVTPTYSGCPATRAIEAEVVRALHARGVDRVALEVRLAPPWTTEWISPSGREKLRAYGIAPPVREPVACPRCASTNVAELSRFGSTPCKALFRCNACLEPFDAFKCH